MCGICGIFDFATKRPVDCKVLENMNRTMVHRGPDDEGYFIDGNVGLAMRRLSIIDVAGGRQPIHNEDKSIWIVFNGEIFNYSELRDGLIKKGHKFYTASDTETILHLYEEYGDECPKYLRGMFAFAIWDTRQQELLLVRDRVGIKPLFYSVASGEKIVFGSEIKAVLPCEGVSREMDLQALDAYFTYCYIPAPLTIYKGIRKLPAGHLLKVTRNSVAIKRYWDLFFNPDYGMSESYFLNKFEELFDEAVRIRLVSEVPLGIFLSAGVDSSMVLAYMAKSMKDIPSTFTVGFGGNLVSHIDERPLARKMALKYHCRHWELEVEPKVDEIINEIVLAFDEPFADDSVIPSYYICKASRKEVTVALTGLGGDELFAGYERYLGLKLGQIYQYVPESVSRMLVAPMITSLPELKSGHYLVNHMKRFIRASQLPMSDRYTSYVSTIGKEGRAELFSDDVSKQIDFDSTTEIMRQYFTADNAAHPLDRAFYQDIKTYLPDDILTLTDRVGMMHSQELRVPFTDHILMEFCATIPAGLKVKYFQKKYLLKKVARKVVPKEVLNHRKQGFSSPMAQWLKGEMNSITLEFLSREKIEEAGIFKYKFIERIINEHHSGKELNEKLIFAMIMFQKWIALRK